MADRDKVIKALELCEIGTGAYCYETECPYYRKECTEGLKHDILAVLKAQEVVVRCKNCKQNGQCSIQFKFADADNPDEWFCPYGKRG